MARVRNLEEAEQLIRADFDRRIASIKAAHVGRKFAVRRDPKTVVRGVVTDIRFGGVDYNGRKYTGALEVDLICPWAKNPTTHTVRVYEISTTPYEAD